MRMKRLWLLNELFVDENDRGQGSSKLLIDKPKELAKSTDVCGVILETGKTNHTGNNLYPRTGIVKMKALIFTNGVIHYVASIHPRKKCNIK